MRILTLLILLTGILSTGCKTFEFTETSKLVNEFYLEFEKESQAQRICRRLNKHKNGYCPCYHIAESNDNYYIKAEKKCLKNKFTLFYIPL